MLTGEVRFYRLSLPLGHRRTSDIRDLRSHARSAHTAGGLHTDRVSCGVPRRPVMPSAVKHLELAEDRNKTVQTAGKNTEKNKKRKSPGVPT